MSHTFLSFHFMPPSLHLLNEGQGPCLRLSRSKGVILWLVEPTLELFFRAVGPGKSRESRQEVMFRAEFPHQFEPATLSVECRLDRQVRITQRSDPSHPLLISGEWKRVWNLVDGETLDRSPSLVPECQLAIPPTSDPKRVARSTLGGTLSLISSLQLTQPLNS